MDAHPAQVTSSVSLLFFFNAFSIFSFLANRVPGCHFTPTDLFLFSLCPSGWLERLLGRHALHRTMTLELSAFLDDENLGVDLCIDPRGPVKLDALARPHLTLHLPADED